jgi:hypothetical protein
MSLLDIGIPRPQRLLGIRMLFPKFFEHSSRDDPHPSNLACSHFGIKIKHYRSNTTVSIMRCADNSNSGIRVANQHILGLSVQEFPNPSIPKSLNSPIDHFSNSPIPQFKSIAGNSSPNDSLPNSLTNIRFGNLRNF